MHQQQNVRKVPNPTAPYWLKATALIALTIALISLLLNAALLYQLYQVQRNVGRGITRAIAALDDLESQELRYDYNLHQDIPVDAAVPLRQTVQVQIDTTVPINTVVEVPLTALGQTVRVNIPINTQVPVNTTVPVHIDETFHISTTVPLDMNVPLKINTNQPPLSEWLAQLRSWLEQTRRSIIGK